MMTEIWWKVFLASIITVIALKLFGVSTNYLKLFSLAFIGWAVGLILSAVISDVIWRKWKGRREKNNSKKE